MLRQCVFATVVSLSLWALPAAAQDDQAAKIDALFDALALQEMLLIMQEAVSYTHLTLPT